MDRRAFLAGAGTVATVATAGCLSELTQKYDAVDARFYCRDEVSVELVAVFDDDTETMSGRGRAPSGRGFTYHVEEKKPNRIALHVERLEWSRGDNLIAEITVVDDYDSGKSEQDWRMIDEDISSSPRGNADVSAELTRW